MRRSTLLWTGAGLASAGLVVALVVTSRSDHQSPLLLPALAAVPSPLARADARYATQPKAARTEYETFVAKNSKSPDPKIQDRVGAARMRLGYLAAKGHDLPKARTAFLLAARAKGTGAMGEFGSVGDQAAYQAVVCLVAQGKKPEAIAGFESLLRDRPLSPLARAAYGRLKRLNGGESKPEWDRLLQNAISKQEARIRFETSVCGPKCLERLLASLPLGRRVRRGMRSGAPKVERGGVPSYKELARLCGTTDAGTTVEGMRKGLKALGRESWAARLSRRDLAKAALPAVLFEGDHYVVLERVEGESATVWDPRYGSTRSWRLPPADDPDFSATVILLSRPEGI